MLLAVSIAIGKIWWCVIWRFLSKCGNPVLRVLFAGVGAFVNRLKPHHLHKPANAVAFEARGILAVCHDGCLGMT